MKVTLCGALAFAVGALSLATPTAAASARVTNGLVVLVPTFDPAAPNQHLGDATAALVREFGRHGIPAVLAVAEPTGAPHATARALCAQNGATELVVESYRLDQSGRGALTDVIVGSVALTALGVPAYAKTHAIVQLDEVDCRGNFGRHASGDTYRTHHGENFDATETDVITYAMHDAVDKFTGVVTPQPNLHPDGMPQIVPATEPTNSPVVGQ